MAAGAGLAPLAYMTRGSARSLPTSGAVADNLCSTNRAGVLSQNDLRYLGSFKMPSDGAFDSTHPPFNMHASGGAITGRTVSGTTTLLVQGPVWGSGQTGAPDVMEMTIPTPSIASPPRATFVQRWLDVRNGRALTKDGLGAQINGICIDPDNPNHLWVGYKQYYCNNSDPCTILAVLNNDGTCTSHGPWRHGNGAYGGPEASSGAVFASLTTIPESWRAHTGGKRLASMGYNQSHLNGLPGGCNLHAWAPLSPSTPPSAVGNPSDYAISDTPLLFYDRLSHRQPRTPNYKRCGWNSNQPEYDATKGAWIHEVDNYWWGAPEVGKDIATASVFVDTGTKHGLLFFGQLVGTVAGHTYENGSPQECHSWYGVNAVDKNGKRQGDPGYNGANSCPHGQNDPTWQATGPGAGTIAGYCWIYDPSDLIPVANRSADPWSPVFTEEFLISSITDCTIPTLTPRIRCYGGAWYDPLTKRIYVSDSEVDKEGCCAYVPRIHVFQVNG
jgi:hypothetical protein